MARPRTPTNILEIRGAYDKHPERKKEREFEPIVRTPIGACPEHLSPEIAAAWIEIVRLAPAGVLTSADALAVELAASLFALHRAGKIDSKDRGQLIVLLGKFGMTPSDRSKVQAPKQKPDNPFAGIA